MRPYFELKGVSSRGHIGLNFCFVGAHRHCVAQRWAMVPCLWALTPVPKQARCTRTENPRGT